MEGPRGNQPSLRGEGVIIPAGVRKPVLQVDQLPKEGQTLHQHLLVPDRLAFGLRARLEAGLGEKGWPSMALRDSGAALRG